MKTNFHYILRERSKIANLKNSLKSIEINGEVRTVKEWAKISGIKYDTLMKRIRKNIPSDQLLLKKIPRVKDIIGEKYNKLTVIDRAENDKDGTAQWLCKCDCGNTKLIKVRTNSLKSGNTKSCGCQLKESAKNRKGKHGYSKRGKTYRLYKIWCGMKKRCNNSNSHQFQDYGGRGIKVCDEWERSFEKFHEWAMSNGYSDNLTIDRIDNNLGYSPDNCKWSNYETQNRNKRNSIKLTINGIEKLLVEWAEEYGINKKTLRERYYRGYKDEELIAPVKNKRLKR